MIWVWILMTMNEQGVIQQSRPMQTEAECVQLGRIVHVFGDTSILCVPRKTQLVE
jgi:hypothetical protein